MDSQRPEEAHNSCNPRLQPSQASFGLGRLEEVSVSFGATVHGEEWWLETSAETMLHMLVS